MARSVSPLQTIKIIEKNSQKVELIKQAIQAKKQASFQREGFDTANEEQRKYDFFISYSRKNLEVVKLIQEKLQDKFNIFFDK